MKLHEYQAKELLKRYGVTVPPGVPVASVEEAELAAATVPRGADGWVVKAQIHAGGRGKAGGVKLAGTPAEVKAAAAAILGKTLVTPQTGPEGRLVRTVLIESASKIARELYAAVVLDRSAARPVMLASAEGGMDIETLAREKPESILREPVDVLRGLRPHAGRALGKRLGLSGKLVAQAGGFFAALARTYLESDASLVEVNPLAVTGDGTLMSLDAKVSLD
ncbi:MAG: ATP-grasp domain-containing protein, partial [bacterium]